MLDESNGKVLVRKAMKLRQRGGRDDFGAFDEDNVHGCTQCINGAWNMLQRDLGNPHVNADDPFFQSRLQVLRGQALHNKRCMCVYLKARIDHITTSWWGTCGIDEPLPRAKPGEAPPTAEIPGKFLSEAERDFLRQYEELNVSYMNALGDVDIRLASTGRPPSGRRHIVLKGLKDHIGISSVTGRTIEVYPGKCMNMIYEDAIPLLAAGIVEEVRNDMG